MTTALLTTDLLAFLPNRESGKYFGWGFASGTLTKNPFNRVSADHDSAAVKPIRDVSLAGFPFKVFKAIIGPNLVYMMDNWKVERIGQKSLGDEAMNEFLGSYAVLNKADFGVSIDRGTRKYFGADVSSTSSSWDKPSKAFYAAKVADLVQSFKAINLLPMLSGKGKALSLIKNVCSAEQVLNKRFDIDVPLRPALVADCDALVTVNIKPGKDSASAESFGPAAVLNESISASGPKLVGYLVNPTSVWDRFPLFSIVRERWFEFWKHLLNKSSDVNPSNDALLCNPNSIGVSLKDGAVCEVSNSFKIRELVAAFKSWNVFPRFVAHLRVTLMPVVPSGTWNGMALQTKRQ